MNKSLLVALLSSLTAVAACSGEVEHVAEAPSASTPSALGIIARCTGEVRCVAAGYPDVVQHFLRKGEACTLGGLELGEGGGIVAEGLTGEATWTTTAEGFSICTGGDCLSCTSSEPAPPTARRTEKKTCSGSAGSCSNRAAGSCSSLEGCDFRQHSRIRYDGQLELEYAWRQVVPARVAVRG